jgi:diaminohydroxyphosphoribosylaminopyrimidine deaminase/5-amino-6-(5-phosphoribosylamino)uracil reductase
MIAAGTPAPTLQFADAHMARALALAERGLYTTDPNPRVGCVLVRDGRVLGEGWHAKAGEPHAEVMALRSVAGEARGATAYVTLEPCSHRGRTPPCADALIAAGIAHVVCAVRDPNPQVNGTGIERLRAAGIEVTVGTAADAARAQNPGFFSRFEQGRPFIRLKLAMSLDARTTPAGGGRAWITGEAARADVQSWRARSSAVVTGAGTVRVDDPRLDVRLSYGPWIRQPLRVVLDPELSCPATARIYDGDAALIFAAAAAAGEAGAAGPPVELLEGRIPIARVPRAPRGLDLRAVIERLTTLAANELLVECGPRLAAGFLEADLVDELIIYVGPKFLGADAAPLAALSGLAAAGVRRFKFHEQCLIGEDLRLVLTPQRG